MLDLHLCGTVWADDLACEEDLVRGKETRNPDPPTRHSLQFIHTHTPTLILIPTLIFQSLPWRSRQSFLFKREKDEGGEKTYQTTFPNLHRSRLETLSTSGVFFYIPVRRMIVKRKGGAMRIATRSISQNQPTV